MRLAALFVLPALVAAHGDHSFDLSDEDAGMSYAERHMHTEHHIDNFDLPAFFKLHDLDLNGFWDEAEIEAVYGLHHHSVKEKMPEEHAQGRAKVVVNKVLQKLDTDKDGKISEAEFIAGGTDGLPSFEGYRDLGHHYDEESEYFLHHEELYHSTPETQTDEAYNHPEDIAHFRHHQHIEDEEDARERKFEGLEPEADLNYDHVVQDDPLEIHSHAAGEGPPSATATATAGSGEGEGEGAGQSQVPLKAGDAIPPRPSRADANARPNRFREAEGDKGKAQGQGRAGHAPRTPEERIRAGSPYKYKMRKGLRADEF